MTKIKSTPELIMAGNWVKRDQNRNQGASVNLEKREFNAPMDSSIASAHMRNHEYTHIAFSEPKKKVIEKIKKTFGSNNPNLIECLGALEDERVNYLGSKRNIDVSRSSELDCYSPTQIREMKERLIGASPKMKALLYASSRHYAKTEITDAIESNMKPEDKAEMDSIIQELRDKQDSTDNPMGDPDATLNAIKRVVQYFKEQEQKQNKQNNKQKGNGNKEEQQGQGGASGDKSEPTKQDIEDFADKANRESNRNTNGITLKDIMNNERKISHTVNDKISWGELREVKEVFKDKRWGKSIKISTKRKPSIDGTYIKYTERFFGNKKIFIDVKKFNIGAILIDLSGSMNFNEDDVNKILKYCSNATIAIYDGSLAGWGKVQIVAKDGKYYSGDLQNIIVEGENIIDGPALQWLGKQRGKKFWVSDGRVTGKTAEVNVTLNNSAMKLKRKHRIVQIYRIDTMRQLVETGKFKTYKDPNPNSIREKKSMEQLNKDTLKGSMWT